MAGWKVGGQTSLTAAAVSHSALSFSYTHFSITMRALTFGLLCALLAHGAAGAVRRLVPALLCACCTARPCKRAVQALAKRAVAAARVALQAAAAAAHARRASANLLPPHPSPPSAGYRHLVEAEKDSDGFYINGRATWFEHPHTGSCGYGRLDDGHYAFGSDAVAAMPDVNPDFQRGACGRCYEVKCRGIHARRFGGEGRRGGEEGEKGMGTTCPSSFPV